MKADPGYFGPDSMMWKINKEITVLFGGARALLMHAAHPLIAAGARQTSFYQRDPWKRLIRTLSLQNSVTFGTKKEADESAHRINKLHEVEDDMDDLTQVTQIYKERLSREQRESAEWNIAKQQLKLGNAYTYANKLGFGASPFFKLGEEK